MLNIREVSHENPYGTRAALKRLEAAIKEDPAKELFEMGYRH